MWKGKNGIYNRVFKRVFDIICALLALTVFSWLYLILALLVRVKLGSPVLFRQDRPGRIDPATGEEKIFQLYKFRSMTDERDENGKPLPDEVRLTRFGRLLRSTSMDELPEAINILKGDMSVVGPRPLAVSYLKFYTEEEHHRHDVRPGLSGLAQVMGRNSISWEEKFSYDLYYAENVSLLLDIKIIFKTVVNVFKREGIGQGSEAPQSLSVERAETKN